MIETTEDLMLGGRIRLRQPRDGFRAGLDAVLLAAFVPARPGERMIEAGCGTGAAFLCLAARVPDLDVAAVEREASMAALARENAAVNGVAARVEEGDVADVALARSLGPFHHALANPPFWPGGTPPPGAIRRAATHESEVGLGAWAVFLAAGLRSGGTASMILPAARFDVGVAALRGAGLGATLLLPLAPREGMEAKRVLMRARKGANGSARILPPLALHLPDGTFTMAVEQVLRGAASLGPA
ncbi:tRNA1(Val) (adenine(37)-N6)-methyltransferase [Neoroseomonas rubea]|uniref:tRNA1(Val) (adenine(37)-N6)-methyltransferase n=1 Tax=Neoroseomonas rubea TaxID=2748666 RepID=UPI002FCCF196